MLLKINHHKLREPLSLRQGSSDEHNYQQIFVDDEYCIETKIAPKTIVDLGANIGLSAIWFASHYPDSLIIAIEPERSNYQLLAENASVYENIRTLRAAVWFEETELHLTDPGKGHWGFQTQEQDSPNAFDRISTVTVRSIMKNHNINHIDILKIDIEGAEVELLSDNSQWISQVNMIIIELHDRFREGCQEALHNIAHHFDQQWQQGENIVLAKSSFINRAA